MIALLPRLRRFAYALTGTWPDADDLVQVTCLRAIDRLEQWQTGTRLDSWMYRIAQNAHRNALRRERRAAAHLREVGADETDVRAGNEAGDRLALKEAEAALARLPDEQRAVLLLVSVEGFGYAEAAKILDLSPGTVASRVSRARVALAAMLDGGANG